KTICRDPLLAQTDAESAVHYQDNLAVVVLFRYTALTEVLKKGEREFIEARNRCGAARWCIYQTYRTRDRQLAELVGEPPRVTLPIRLPDRLTVYVGGDLMRWAATLVGRSPANRPRPTAAANCERVPASCADD